MTWPSSKPIFCMFSLVALPLGTAPGSVSIVRICELIARNARVYRGEIMENVSTLKVLPYLEYDPVDHSIESIPMVEENNVHHHKPGFNF